MLLENKKLYTYLINVIKYILIIGICTNTGTILIKYAAEKVFFFKHWLWTYLCFLAPGECLGMTQQTEPGDIGGRMGVVLNTMSRYSKKERQ